MWDHFALYCESVNLFSQTHLEREREREKGGKTSQVRVEKN